MSGNELYFTLLHSVCFNIHFVYQIVGNKNQNTKWENQITTTTTNKKEK